MIRYIKKQIYSLGSGVLLGVLLCSCSSSPFMWKTHLSLLDHSHSPMSSSACTLLFSHQDWVLHPPKFQWSASNKSIRITPKEGELTNGIWWWSHPTHFAGAVRWISSSLPTRWLDLLNQLKSLKILRFYTESTPLLKENSSRLKHWHRFLHDHHRKSDLLLGELSWICKPQTLFKLIQEHFIPFQKKANPQERFDGIYLDLEPHALNHQSSLCPFTWTLSSPIQKQDLLYGLLYTLISLRTLLNQELDHSLFLSVYLPFWFDQIDLDTRIWDTPQQRDVYYQCLDDTVDAVSIASYCRSDPQEIKRVFLWEYTHFPTKMRLGLNATHQFKHSQPKSHSFKHQTCSTWKNNQHLVDTLKEIKALFSNQDHRISFDFENLVYWIHSNSSD